MCNEEKWGYYLKDLESPEPFIKWTLYWTVAAALQRRVYMGTVGDFCIFPNIYVVFIAPPGVGKSMSARLAGSQILKTFYHIDPKITYAGTPITVEDIPFSADNSSLPSLIRQLANSTRHYEWTDKEKKINKSQHCSLAILLSEEMTSLFQKSNDGVAAFLNHCFDCRDYEYKMKTEGVSDTVKNPCVNFLGCTTPNNMKELMSTKILQEGFTARAIFVYCEKPRFRKSEILITEDQKSAFESLREHIKKLVEIRGSIDLTPEAKEWFTKYYESGEMDTSRINKDKVLDHYYARKKIHIKKLAMIHHFVENISSQVGLESILKAIKTLNEVEVFMHKGMASSSRNPLHDSANAMLNFLESHGPTSRLQLRCIFNKEVNDEELSTVLQFLLETNQIVSKPIENKDKYCFVNRLI